MVHSRSAYRIGGGEMTPLTLTLSTFAAAFGIGFLTIRFMIGAQRNRNQQRRCGMESIQRAKSGMRPPLTGIEKEAIRFQLMTEEIERDYAEMTKFID